MSGVMKPNQPESATDSAMKYWQMYQTVKGAAQEFSNKDKQGAFERRKKSQVMTPAEKSGGMPGLGG